ncbi:hypothetical protein [Thermoflexus hugenholtzii]
MRAPRGLSPAGWASGMRGVSGGAETAPEARFADVGGVGRG